MSGHEIGTALVAALGAAAVLVFGLKWRHPSSSGPIANLVFLACLFFLPLWAAVLWIPSTPKLGITFALALLVLATAPPGAQVAPAGTLVGPPRRDSRISTTFGLFFWVMVVTWLLPVAGGYLR